MKMLLNRGANPNASPSGNESALCRAVRRDNASFVDLLLANGADVNKKPWGGETPLVVAAR